MKYAKEGKDYIQHFDFEVNGELVVPLSASYSVRNNGGDIVGGLEDQTISLSDSQTSIDILIPSTVQTISQDYELRYVDLEFVYNGITYQFGDFYNVRESIYIPVKPQDVRQIFSASTSEIPDERIDIQKAYLDVQTDAGTSIEAILTGGNSQLPSLIEAIKYRAAIDIAISIETAILQSEQSDNTIYSRFASIDYTQFRIDLQGRYATALRVIVGQDTPTTPSLFVTFTDTDAVTGT